jgi:hypothetical protein
VPVLFQPPAILQVQRLSARLSTPEHAEKGQRLLLSRPRLQQRDPHNVTRRLSCSLMARLVCCWLVMRRLGRRRSTWRAVRTPIPSQWLTFQTTNKPEPRFCALLTEGATEMRLALS